MKTSVSVCPVPSEQQPINEYQGLKESWFYSWGMRTWRGYLMPIGILWSLSLLITWPIASVSFPWAKMPLHLGLSAAVGALVIPTLALIQLYLGWRYVQGRLLQAKIPYEESGWYDGQIWTKPDEVLSRDRLIVQHQIRPVLQRLHWTFASLAIALLLGVGVWSFL